MRRGLTAAIVTGCIVAAYAGSSTAFASEGCNGFFHNSDGSWSPTHIFVMGAFGSPTQVGPSDRLRAGTPGLNGRIGAYLDAHCQLGGNAGRAVVIPRMP